MLVTEDIKWTLRYEIGEMAKKGFIYCDEELLSLMENMVFGLQFLREKKCSVSIDLDHICRTNEAYKWTGYESIGFYDHALPLLTELTSFHGIILIVISTLFNTNDSNQLQIN